MNYFCDDGYMCPILSHPEYEHQLIFIECVCFHITFASFLSMQGCMLGTSVLNEDYTKSQLIVPHGDTHT